MGPNEEIAINSDLGDLERSIIRTLLYFDIFDYPLTLTEIANFCQGEGARGHIQQALSLLEGREVIFRFDQYYSLWADESNIHRRKRGNALAQKRLKTARLYARLISCFPFVRCIMLSGSLSKDYMDENSDIDYFIVTSPRRVWITRALLASFKRIFLLNSHRNFCTNYFIDTAFLEIEEKNIYTAIETATLLPVYGEKIWMDFTRMNSWVNDYLPNRTLTRTAFLGDSAPWLRTIAESLFPDGWTDRLNRRIMEFALNGWKKRFGKTYVGEDFDIAFKSSQHVSKNHPLFYQKKVLELYRSKTKAFEEENKLKLTA